MNKSKFRSPIQSGAKSRILKALFAEATKLGISQEILREDIAPGVIGKRLSKCSSQEVARVLVHIHNRHGIPEPTPNPSQEGNPPASKSPLLGGDKGVGRIQYESSRAGLLEEIRDLAIARFGDDYASPLNAFCARFGEPDGFRKMRVNQMKIIKQRLKELQREDPRGENLKSGSGILPDITTGKDACPTKVIQFQKGRKGFFNQLWEMDRPGE